MTSSISSKPRPSSLVDRARVRGVKKKARANRRRRGEPRSPKRESLTRAFKVAGVLAVIGGLGFGVRALYAHALTSPVFAIDHLSVSGTERASERSILELSGVSRQDNLLAVDVDEVARTVEAHPWVASAELRRHYPDGLEIVVVEHLPVVLVALDHLYYANRSGEIVKRYAPGERELLPVVTGISRDQIETDDGESRARLLRALSFLEALDASLAADAPEVAEIHLGSEAGLAFTPRGEDVRIVVGHPPWGPRIARLNEVRSALDERGVRASRIMLDGQRRGGRAVARLAGPSPAAGE